MSEKSASSAPPPLPPALRRACILCLVLSGLVGLYSVFEVNNLAYLREIQQAPAPALPFSDDPEVNARILRAHVSALEGMRVPRALTLVALSFCCGFAFVGALRMLRPGELPRAVACRLLGGSALWAGILRTIDGAQMAAVIRRVVLAASEVVLIPPRLSTAGPQELQQAKALAGGLGVALVVVQTAVIAGMFVLLAQYFRSRRVEELLAKQ